MGAVKNGAMRVVRDLQGQAITNRKSKLLITTMH